MPDVSVSIIVPVYKAEKYLCRCLDSIASQTFTDWECILIDDGSPDKSGAICDEYASRDRRFRVIHQQNKGVSVARNVGLDTAAGTYIAFVDSDDWIDSQMLSQLYSCAVENCAEVVICGTCCVKGKKYSNETTSYGWMEMPKDFAVWRQGPWAKLFLRTFLSKHNICFPEGIALAEDLYFTFHVFFTSHKIFGITESFYHYFWNPESAVHTVSSKKIADERFVLGQIESVLTQAAASSDWFLFLESRKIRVKNRYLFSLAKPDVTAWNSCYPELSDIIVHKAHGIKKFFLFCARHNIRFVFYVFPLLRRLRECFL
ncbi:MAG: glycosyltransferase [Treponema sp.]|nr:glycosyltransferase [Treponema sp.]